MPAKPINPLNYIHNHLGVQGLKVNPFSPTCATFLAELCNPITRQAIELESCSNPLRIQKVL